MRITPLILIIIGILGMVFPEKFLNADTGGGRWVFGIIIVLGLFTMWRTIKKSRQRDNDL